MLKQTEQTPSGETGFAISRGHFIAMVAAMMALNALAIDITLPAFPRIVSDFSISDPNNAQYVLLSYVIGFGSAQLAYGPISDRFGRRKPLFVGLAIYMIFALAGVFAPNYELLLAARFIQGLGAAGTRVIALALVRDRYSGRMMASTMSLVMMVFMAVPIVAPSAGQILVMLGNWHMILIFMAVIGGAVLAWCWRFLPETLPTSHRRKLSLKSVREAFRLSLTNRISLCYAVATGFFFGSLFSYLNMAQPIYAKIYDLGTYFPVAFAITGLLMAVSSYANSRLVGHFGQRRLSHGALTAFLALGIVMTVVSWNDNPPLWLFMLIVALILPLIGLIAANLNSIAMEPLGSVAGTASALLGFVQTVGGGITGTVIGQFYHGQIVTLGLGFASVSAIALGLIFIAEKGRLFGVGEQELA